MAALTDAEKQANYRSRKMVAEFKTKTELPDNASVEDFMVAAANEDLNSIKSYCGEGFQNVDQIDGAFARAFWVEIDNYDYVMASEAFGLDPDEMETFDDYRVYAVADLLRAWKNTFNAALVGN
jgi:hypothetical protein